MTAPGGTGASALDHEAFLYRGPDDYREGVLSFLREGLAAGEPALVAVPEPGLGRLRPALAGSAGVVELVDMAQVGRNPGRIIPAIRRFLDDHPARRVRVVGEPIWAGRTPAEVREATRHEALLTTAFATTPLSILCPYHAPALDDEVIADAMRTHPGLRGPTGRHPSPAYTDALVTASLSGPGLPPPPARAEARAFHHGDLGNVRALVAERAREAGIHPSRVEDLVLAVSEVATNTLVHAGTPGTLRVWREAAEGALTAELSDPGCIPDPMVGRVRPEPGADGGRGLWLVHQLCDLVEVHSGHWGTAVRLHMRP